MTVDEHLADRIRELMSTQPGLSEGRMFGGVAFMVGGHMAVCASGQGGLLVRVDPAAAERLVTSTSATPMQMRGRDVRGWLRIPAEDVRTTRQLSTWVRRGVACATALPPKAPKRTGGE